MVFPDFDSITPKTLRELQIRIGLSNKDMAKLIGISEKTWLNRISAPIDTQIKLLSRLEYTHLKNMAMNSIS